MIDARDLRVDFATKRGVVAAVRGISFTLGREKLGIVGEFGFRQVDDRARHHAAVCRRRRASPPTVSPSATSTCFPRARRR